ncbi:hypothetical protein [Streptomyces murinus]|uniref:hypothetical protein n=1 Tax=Streptomyces murinus TaxID=33900 RepID=UPI003F45BA8C
MPAQHDRPPPPATERPHRGVTATVSAVLRHDRGALAAATVRVVGLSALAGLLMTALIFVLSWPLFTRMRNRRTWYHHLEDPCTATPPWPGSPSAPLFIATLLRLALAPAAAATGLGPRAALRRSWSLTRTRAGATRVLALALPPAALCAAVTRLATQLALPLRPLVRTLLEQATGNFFAAYYAGILAPAIVGILVTAATTLPLTCTAFAALHDHLRPSRASPRDTGGTAAASTA